MYNIKASIFDKRSKTLLRSRKKAKSTWDNIWVSHLGHEHFKTKDKEKLIARFYKDGVPYKKVRNREGRMLKHIHHSNMWYLPSPKHPNDSVRLYVLEGHRLKDYYITKRLLGYLKRMNEEEASLHVFRWDKILKENKKRNRMNLEVCWLYYRAQQLLEKRYQ